MENLNIGSSFPLDDWKDFEEKIDTLNDIILSKDVANLKKKSTEVCNRSCFNTSKAKNEESIANLSSDSLSPNIFMKMVENDAKKRFEDRTERNYEASKLKDTGNQEFKKGNYEKALCSFNKALDLRRDSYVLYINRALTYMRLGLYTKCIQDCNAALKLKESLKGRLLKIKAYFAMGDKKSSESLLEETRTMFKNDTTVINDYIAEWHK